MDKVILYTILVVILAGLAFWGVQSGFLGSIFSSSIKPVSLPDGTILFYGQGCSHCKNVDDYIKNNNIEQKVSFTRIEVWYNKSNAALLGQVAEKCSLTSNSVGVPFLYDGKNCLIGEVDVINFFKIQAGIK